MDIPTRNQLDSQLAYVQRLVEDSTGKAEPDYARVSIALGAFEALFTDTKQAEVLDIQVGQLLTAFCPRSEGLKALWQPL